MLAVDHKGPIKPATTRGNKFITSIIDRFSGKVWSYAVPRIDAKTTAITLMNNFSEFGVPEKLLSDQGGDFISEVVVKLCKIMNIKKLKTGAYEPSTDGTAERWNRTLSTALRQISTDLNLDFTDGDSWDLFVKMIASQHNNNYSKRIGMSPNQCDTGMNVRLPIEVNTELEYINSQSEEATFYNSYVRNMKKMTQAVARLRLEKYDKKRKDYYDKFQKEKDYKVGDLVIYYTGPWDDFSKQSKLKSKWRGP